MVAMVEGQPAMELIIDFPVVHVTLITGTVYYLVIHPAATIRCSLHYQRQTEH